MNSHDALSDFLAGDLSGEALTSFVTHISECRHCRDAVEEDRRGSALISSATTEVSELEMARLVGTLRNVRIESSPKRTAPRFVVAAAAALILVIGAVWAVRWSGGDAPAHTSASVVSELVDGAAMPTASVTTRTLIVEGHTVFVAESTYPFPMPPDGSPVETSASDVWLVQRDGINVVCQNGPTSRLVASTLPAAQLAELVASGQLG